MDRVWRDRRSRKGIRAPAGYVAGKAYAPAWRALRVGRLLRGSRPPVFYEEGGAAAGKMSDQRSRLNWVTVGALALFHAGAFAALFLFTWQALWIALALLWISGGWGIEMGYHRLLTLRGYETPRWLEWILTICGTLALQGGRSSFGSHRTSGPCPFGQIF